MCTKYADRSKRGKKYRGQKRASENFLKFVPQDNVKARTCTE